MYKHLSMSLILFEYEVAERPRLLVTLYLQTFSRFISSHSWNQTIVFSMVSIDLRVWTPTEAAFPQGLSALKRATLKKSLWETQSESFATQIRDTTKF